MNINRTEASDALPTRPMVGVSKAHQPQDILTDTNAIRPDTLPPDIAQTYWSVRPQQQRWVYLRDLLRELVVRDIKVRYKHSILGFAWSLLNPLLQLLVFYFVFGLVLAIDMPRYSSYVFSGLLIYGWFQTSLIHAADAITDNGELIRRPGFPVAILPIVVVITNLIHFLLACPVLFILLWLEGSRLGLSLLAMLGIIAIQFALTLGLAFFVAGVNVIFRDIQYLLSILLQFFFFLTPIFYDSNMVPPAYQTIYRLNPFVPLMDEYRAILLAGTQPSWLPLWWPSLLAVLALWTGYRLFIRLKYHFAEEL